MKSRIIISGGGTGGHIFPAISIANALREQEPECQILFVGATGRMEMEKVPQAGYEIVGLPVAGLDRKNFLKNISLPFKLIKSLNAAKKIIKEFQPDVVVGVGGYASAPTLWAASKKGIPCLIQEQNSFAGLTNKILGKKVNKICVAYDNMDKFFPADKIIFTGNPTRKEIEPPTQAQREEGIRFYNLNPEKKTIFVVGGSLGAKTLNETVKKWIIEKSKLSNYQILWQSGKYYKKDIDEFLSLHPAENVINLDFIQRMDLAYAASDLIISRAGAGTISELCLVGAPTIFVPSPVVAEDHQTHNAMALVNKGAAIMVKDIEAKDKLIEVAETLLNNSEKLEEMRTKILNLGTKNASELIVKEVLSLRKIK